MAFFSEKQKKVSKSMMLLFLSVSVQGLYAGFVFTNAPRGLSQKKRESGKQPIKIISAPPLFLT